MPTTIVVNALTRQSTATNEAIFLDIIVKESDFVGTYDQLQIWRSVFGMSGVYEELTAMGVLQAVLPGNAGPPAAIPGPSVFLAGKTLELTLDRELSRIVVITFAGVDPQPYSSAVAQVIAQASLYVVAYVDATGKFVLKTVDAGQGASLRVSGGDAASVLGLPLSTSVGRDARLSLTAEVLRYGFTDFYGSSKYFYKTRFYNSSNQAVGEFTQPFSAATRVVVTPGSTITGYANLVQVDGRPLVDQTVRVYAEFTGSLIDNKALVGSDIIKRTDVFGRVEFQLIRGHKVTVSIPGTSIYRTITIPIDPVLEMFNLLDPDIADDDIFKAAVPNIVIAERRSLE